jgi:hypothetical protein
LKNVSIKNTFCIFTELELEQKPTQAPDYCSDSGSNYFYTNEGVFRLSNHWGRAGNSKWRLKPLEKYKDLPNRREKLGFANWDNFHPDNTTDKLYFIELDFANRDIHFNHKNNIKETQEVVFRTSFETAKIIRKIRSYYQSNSKFKHFENDTAIEYFLLQLINKPT